MVLGKTARIGHIWCLGARSLQWYKSSLEERQAWRTKQGELQANCQPAIKSIFMHSLGIDQRTTKHHTKRVMQTHMTQDIYPKLRPFHTSGASTHFISAGVRACTTLVPSINLVLKIRLALPNMPSFKLTTINWLPLNLVRIRRPIFCVCERSSAASTSSRMYIGAGEYWRSERMRERAMRELHVCMN